MPREVRAPGKIVLLGEYAVLDGAPALVLAIDSGVRCEVLPGDGIETPDGDTRYVGPALEGAPPALYRFSDWNPVNLPAKAGFGGSAAACVAACLAAGRPATEAYAIHRGVQGGGSGLDVAASIHGGFLRSEAGQATDLGPPIVPVVIWSGRSAATAPRGQAWHAWADRWAFVEAMRRIVDHFFENPVDSLAAAATILGDMSRRAGIHWDTAAHARIRALAEDCGGAAKASGAGGGDCAVALFPTASKEADFKAACARDGLTVLPVAPSPGAYVVETGDASSG